MSEDTMPANKDVVAKVTLEAVPAPVTPQRQQFKTLVKIARKRLMEAAAEIQADNARRMAEMEVYYGDPPKSDRTPRIFQAEGASGVRVPVTIVGKLAVLPVSVSRFFLFRYVYPRVLGGTITLTTPGKWLEWTAACAMNFADQGDEDSRLLSVSRTAAEFYLLLYLATLPSTAASAKKAHEELVGRIVPFFKDYTFQTCAAEARHAGRFVHVRTDIPTTGKHTYHLHPLSPTACDFCRWHQAYSLNMARIAGGAAPIGDCVHTREYVYESLQAPEDYPGTMRYLKELFDDVGLWTGSYGGPPWALVAEIGAELDQNPLVACDHLFNLCHNGGTVFSKGTAGVAVPEMSTLLPILNIKSSATRIGHYVGLLPHITLRARELFRRAAADAVERGEAILWDGEVRETEGKRG